MPTWVTHLAVADRVMKGKPELDRRGFCVGNIAPDCNVENEDWTAFTPSREVTHWMSGNKKVSSDADLFCEEYIIKRKAEIRSSEEYSFLLGYYSHLITDAEYQRFIRDENRIRDMWQRIKTDEILSKKAYGYPENFDSVKMLISKEERYNEIYAMEAEYLRKNPNSGFLTEIVPLKEFPDYIDYLPSGCIVRKIGVMGYVPEADENSREPVCVSREEYGSFISNATVLVINKFREKKLI